MSINTSDIPNGTYFLHIFQGKEIIKKQIIIRH
ncbi:T9SS type A sorting domain-containing protein [Pedobacter steynii]